MASYMKYQLKDFNGLSDSVLIPFEEEVKPELLCCTCNSASPMGLKDGKGHTFCLRCARVHTDGCNEFTCSLCGWQAQLNYMTTNTEEWCTVEKLAAACPNVDTACSFKGTFKDVLIHYKDCGLKTKVECPFCGYLQDRKALPDHMRDECKKRVVECIFCDKDLEAWEKQIHQAHCRQRPGSCQHCHEEFKTFAELEDEHYPQCGRMPVDCSLAALGCDFVTQRIDMALHEMGGLQHNAILVREIAHLKEENKVLRESLAKQEEMYKNCMEEMNSLSVLWENLAEQEEMYKKSMAYMKSLLILGENKVNNALSNHAERIKDLEKLTNEERKKSERRLGDLKKILEANGLYFECD